MGAILRFVAALFLPGKIIRPWRDSISVQHQIRSDSPGGLPVANPPPDRHALRSAPIANPKSAIGNPQIEK
jgi:hypothetical protein